MAPKALEFIVLTASRVSEAVNAKWDEIDFPRKLWVVPAQRMKAHRPRASRSTVRCGNQAIEGPER